MVTINIYQAQGNDAAQSPGSSSSNATQSNAAPSPTMQPGETSSETQTGSAPIPTMQPGGGMSEAQTGDGGAPSPTIQPGETSSETQTGSAPTPTMQPNASTGELQAIEQSNQHGGGPVPEPSTKPPGASPDQTVNPESDKKGNKKK